MLIANPLDDPPPPVGGGPVPPEHPLGQQHLDVRVYVCILNKTTVTARSNRLLLSQSKLGHRMYFWDRGIDGLITHILHKTRHLL